MSNLLSTARTYQNQATSGMGQAAAQEVQRKQTNENLEMQEEQAEDSKKTSMTMAGGMAGAYLGAQAGAVGGPAGMAIGAVIGFAAAEFM